MKRVRVNESETRRIIDMAKDHIPTKEIARLMGTSRNTVYNILQRYGEPTPERTRQRLTFGWRKLDPTEGVATIVISSDSATPATLDLSALTPETQAGYLSMRVALQAKLDIAKQQAEEAEKLRQEELEKVAKLTQKIELLEELIGEITAAE